MSANLDRFSCGVTPKIPDEVGSCEVCGGTIYDYELINCSVCDAKIHIGCAEECDGCGRVGCKLCLKENEEGLLHCETCKEKTNADSNSQTQ
ncbi:MAG: hypothetical protein MUP16_05650 [Sedimentisphaerales bacterium]|nr:hypothetical protein [Sedimentisphaerales bacterium]